jgi:heat shock protein HslJ
VKRLILIALALGLATTLVACGGSGSSGLTGKTWNLTAITEKVPAFQGVIPAADQSKYTIAFNSDGTFNAKADCNQVNGSYKTSGSDGLTITPGASTMAFCGEASFGTQFVEGLSKAASYAISGSNLTITLSDGGTMTFVAA